MTAQLVIGEIPYRVPRLQTGRFLTLESFGFRRSGVVPVSYRHWRDNDREFKNRATWGATSTGLTISHVLDDSIEFEAEILAAIKAGRLVWSYGDGPTPTATRAAIAAGEGRRIAYIERPLTDVRFDHVSYGEAAAFDQLPIKWVGFDLGNITTEYRQRSGPRWGEDFTITAARRSADFDDWYQNG